MFWPFFVLSRLLPKNSDDFEIICKINTLKNKDENRDVNKELERKDVSKAKTPENQH